MTPINLEPMNIGMILDTTFKLYFRNFFLMIALVAVPLLPYQILVQIGTIMFPVDPYGVNMDLETVLGFYLFLMAGMFYMGFFGYPLSIGSITYALSRLYMGESVTFGQAMAAAFKRLPTLIWTSFLVGLMVFAGTLFCVIPGFYLMISYLLVIPVIMLEGNNSEISRGRAWSLVEGRRVEVFAVFIVLYVVTMMISGTPGILNFFFPRTTFHLLWIGVVQACAYFVVAPLMSIAPVLLYYNARIEKEGFDLEMLAHALGTDGDELLLDQNTQAPS